MFNWYDAGLAQTLSVLGEVLPQTNLKADLQPRTMVGGLLLAALAFILSWLIGRPLMRWLKAKKIGKSIQAELPESHQLKSGTPTMGGLMIIAAIVMIAVGFILIPTWITTGKPSAVLLPIGIMISCGILGAIDDMLSLVGRESNKVPVPGETKLQRRRREMLARRGLSMRFKLVWLLIISLIAAIVMFGPLGLFKVYIPFVATPVDIGWAFLPVATLVVAGMANAVNFADGLDTLAGSTCLMAFVGYGIIGFLQDQPQVVWIAFSTAGACMGFLWYNANPAQVFMGDTGALTLGALLAVLAFQTNQWLLLPIVGLIFIIEMASVIIQIGYFKLTKGKRFFKMAPIHLHFQKSGWSENQVTMRFLLVGAAAMMVSVALALL